MTFSGYSGRIAILGFMLILGSGLSAQNFRAVMVRGNSWLTENPGFGNQAVAALFGEYRIETAAGSAPQGGFFIRVSADPQLLQGEGWQSWPGAASYVQRREGSSLFIGFPFNGGPEVGAWVILFQFQVDSDNAPPDDAFISRLISTWTSRFRYFLSRLRGPSDISLPAVVNF